MENYDDNQWQELPEAQFQIFWEYPEQLEEQSEALIINLAEQILVKALVTNSSSIHLEPVNGTLQVRFRQFGVLQRFFDPFPQPIFTSLISRFKILADLDVCEQQVVQDGFIVRRFQGCLILFRVNCLPHLEGEKIVLRVWNEREKLLKLEDLIVEQSTLKLIQVLATSSSGLIVITGPAGNGKTTTLLSLLTELNHPEISISLVDDYLEGKVPGITQVKIDRERGMNFSYFIRAFMRQDSDIIVVSETRDTETAKTIVEAAFAGHLILTTTHTGNAAQGIVRFDEMGIAPYLLSETLKGVIAQRLLRRVCPDCAIAYTPTLEELIPYDQIASDLAQLTIYKAHFPGKGANRSQESVCANCSGFGYKGYVSVYEVLPITQKIKTLINQMASPDEIHKTAVSEGMKTMLDYSLDLVRKKVTTLAEINRFSLTDSTFGEYIKQL